jgi:two-component system OmpR family sensor kinase
VRRFDSLRGRLLAAVGLVAAACVALSFTISAVLARRTVERNTLADVSAQADLLAERERAALTPLGRGLESIQSILDEQGERVVRPRLDGSSPFLPPAQARALRRGVPIDETVTVDGTRYFLAGRLVGGKAFVLLRPTARIQSAWLPHLEGLLVGAGVAFLLAVLAAIPLARAISRPVRHVAEATRRLALEGETVTVPVEGSRELRLLGASFNEMAEQLERARAAERAFLLSVSHELKTPLTAIRGYAEGLAEGALPAEESVETIQRESARLEALVHDLLDLARMNKSEFTVRHEPIDLAATAVEAAQRYEPHARAYGVALEAVVDGAAPATGDAGRMLQVVSNLVENALRVTPSGGSVRIVATPGVVAVEDTGPGLRAEELPHAFERFYLTSRYQGERPVGTGLGLAIVRQLVDGMGGDVRVTSAPGGPTRFTVALPVPETFYARLTSGEQPADAAGAGSGRTLPGGATT